MPSKYIKFFVLCLIWGILSISIAAKGVAGILYSQGNFISNIATSILGYLMLHFLHILISRKIKSVNESMGVEAVSKKKKFAVFVYFIVLCVIFTLIVYFRNSIQD